VKTANMANQIREYKATNTSAIAATNYSQIIEIPFGFKYVSHLTQGADTYDPITGIWTIPSLPAGASRELRLTISEVEACPKPEPDCPVVVQPKPPMVMPKPIVNPGGCIGGNCLPTAQPLSFKHNPDFTIRGVIPDCTRCDRGTTAYRLDNEVNAQVDLDVFTGAYNVRVIDKTLPWSFDYYITCRENECSLGEYGPGTVDGDPICEQPLMTVDLAVTKTSDQEVYNVGDTITYTIEVSNSGMLDATNVSVTDTLPAEVQFVSTTLPTPTHDGSPAGGVLTSTLPFLAIGESVTYEIVAVAVSEGSQVENCITVEPGDGLVDGDLTNNEYKHPIDIAFVQAMGDLVGNTKAGVIVTVDTKDNDTINCPI